MIYFKLQNELCSEEMGENFFNIVIVLLVITMLHCKNKMRSAAVKEHTAKPAYLRYVKYDPETGNIKSTD